jgi:hypothetical protein
LSAVFEGGGRGQGVGHGVGLLGWGGGHWIL